MRRLFFAPFAPRLSHAGFLVPPLDSRSSSRDNAAGLTPLQSKMTDHGCLLTGSNATVFSECPWNTRFVLLPHKKFEGFTGPQPTLPRSPGHHAEWIRACKGESKTFSPFSVGGPQTEMLLLGNVALLAGRPIEYDPLTGKIAGDAQAERFLHREYRPGWSL